MNITPEEKTELLDKFLALLSREEIDQNAMASFGAFSIALECVSNPDLMDKMLEAHEKGRLTASELPLES